MGAYPITDQATTLMYNVQSKAALSNVNLRAIILWLRAALDKEYKVAQTSFDANIPDVDLADLPALISEVEGYLDGILQDAEMLKDGIANNSAAAIAKIEQLLAGLTPPDVSTELDTTTIAGADDVLAANRASADTERRIAEMAALSSYAAKRFPLPPGACVQEIADIRLKMGSTLAGEASKVLQQQAEENLRFFINKVEKTFKYTADLINAWENLYAQVLNVIGQVIADYEQSPLMNAEVQSKTAAALVDAYAGLNRAAQSISTAAGTSYKAELAPARLQALEDSLQLDAYEAGMKLSLSARSRIASAMAQALHGAGSAAGAAIGAVGAHGSFTERAFS